MNKLKHAIRKIQCISLLVFETPCTVYMSLYSTKSTAKIKATKETPYYFSSTKIILLTYVTCKPQYCNIKCDLNFARFFRTAGSFDFLFRPIRPRSSQPRPNSPAQPTHERNEKNYFRPNRKKSLKNVEFRLWRRFRFRFRFRIRFGRFALPDRRLNRRTPKRRRSGK